MMKFNKIYIELVRFAIVLQYLSFKHTGISLTLIASLFACSVISGLDYVPILISSSFALIFIIKSKRLFKEAHFNVNSYYSLCRLYYFINKESSSPKKGVFYFSHEGDVKQSKDIHGLSVEFTIQFIETYFNKIPPVVNYTHMRIQVGRGRYQRPYNKEYLVGHVDMLYLFSYLVNYFEVSKDNVPANENTLHIGSASLSSRVTFIHFLCFVMARKDEGRSLACWQYNDIKDTDDTHINFQFLFSKYFSVEELSSTEYLRVLHRYDLLKHKHSLRHQSLNEIPLTINELLVVFSLFHHIAAKDIDYFLDAERSVEILFYYSGISPMDLLRDIKTPVHKTYLLTLMNS